MAACAQATARRAWLARRGLLVATIGCGVLGLQSLPSAAAAKNSAGPTVAASAEPSAAVTRRAERAAARAEAPAPPPAAAPPAAEAPPPPPLSGAGPALRGAGSRGAERPVPPARARREERRERRAPQATTAPAGEEASAASEGSSSASAVAPARSQKKGTGKKDKEKPKEKEKPKAKEKEGGKAKGKKTGTSPEEPAEAPAEEEGSSVLTVKSKGALSELEPTQATAVAASVSDSAPAPVPATAAAIPAGGTGTTSIDSLAASAKAQPVSGSGASRAARAKAAAHGKTAKGATASAGSASATPLAPLRALAATTAAAQPRAKRVQKASTQPAIVKSITRIVGVVPTPVRVLILALIALALLLGARSLFSGVRTRRLVRQRGQLLEDVGALQAALLPVPPERLGPVGTSVAYRPADGPGAGGDFYDVFALEDGRLAVIVGDVSGHGREALPHTALVRFTVRAYLEAGLAPGKALQTAGNVLERQLSGSFATVVAAIYHPRERTLTYASAGHPPPLVHGERPGSDQAAIAPVTSCSASPIGAGTRTGTRQTVVAIPGPASLCFHTDGVTEARIAGELFGAERLAELLAGLDADADASALLDRVTERSDERPDDMAACLLRVQDGAGAPSIVFEQLELDRDGAVNPRAKRFLLDCGVPQAEAELLMRDARARLEHADSVLLELRLGEARPRVSLHDDNVIRPAALAVAGTG
jgi:Stage II sporulation protein E (SpoIIE)